MAWQTLITRLAKESVIPMSASDSEDVSPDDATENVSGIGPQRSERLEREGYETVGDLQDASVEELAEILPGNVAQAVKQRVGDGRRNVPNVAKARQQAQRTPGAKARTIRTENGQETKILTKVDEQHLPGATVEIRKG